MVFHSNQSSSNSGTFGRFERRVSRRIRARRPGAPVISEVLEPRRLLSVTYTSIKVSDFNGTTNGMTPNGPLVFETGNLFGVTAAGGGDGGIGTAFEVPANSNGAITTLANLGDPGKLAATPIGGLVSDGGGNLFGVDQGGGDGSGSVFELAGGTAFSTIATFDGNGIDTPVSPTAWSSATTAIFS